MVASGVPLILIVTTKTMNKDKISVGRYLLATAIPTAFVIIAIIFYLGKLNQDIALTQQELQGQNITQHLFHATLALKNIRGMRQFQFAGIKSYDAAIAENQQAFEQWVNSLLNQPASDDFNIRDILKNTQHQNQQLHQQATNKASRHKALEQFHAYSKIIKTLYNLSLTIAYQSHLNLESSLDIHYLVDIAVERLPLMTEHLGQIRGLTASVLLNDSDKQQSALDIHYHVTALQTTLQRLFNGQHLLNETLDNKQFVQADIKKLEAGFQTYIKRISFNKTKRNDLQHTNELFSDGSALVKVSTDIFNQITENLKTQLESRLQSLYQQRRTTLSIGSLAIMVIIFFIGYFYRNNRQALQAILFAKKQTEDTEVQQRYILEEMVDGVITIDQQGIIHSINPAGERIFGYAANEVIGKNVKILMPAPYHAEHDGYLNNYMTSGQAKIIGIGRQVNGLRKNGQVFPLDLAVSEISFKKTRMFSGIVRDISERVEAAKAIQGSASRLQTVLNHVVDGIITIEKVGTVQSFNPAAENIFGYTANEVIGNNIKMLMPSPYQAEHDGYLESYQLTGKAHIIGSGREVEGLRKNGTVFPLDLAVSEMVIDGEPVYSGIVRDITERKQVEKMKNEFISTVSHELRTPLTSIRGSLGLVMSETMGKLSAPVKDMLTITANNTERLLLLINDILDVQKIESGMMAFRFHSMDLQPFLQQAIQINQSYADQYDVRFVLMPGQDNIRVYADGDRLMQVMSNLMSNAAKFSPKGETIEVNVARHNGAIRISISDHGPGIPKDFHDKLFEKFTQHDSTDTRQKGGTGLGLSITRLIVEKHGGLIDFVSQPQVGTTFYFELPELISDLSSSDLPLELKGSHVPCILIVEDDSDVAALLQRMLAEAGFNSDVAYTAAEARKLLREKGDHYKAMTLDIILPDESGIDLLTSIRQNEETRDLPVIVVSIKADEAKRELNGGAVGILDWISKPIDQKRLQHVVRHAAGPKAIPRVLHVEDEQDIHLIVSKMLQNDCELVWTTTVSASKDILEQEDFDLVLLDISLPDGSGLDLLETIERRVNPPRVVIFSAQNVNPEITMQVNGVLVKSHTTNKQLLETITSAIDKL